MTIKPNSFNQSSSPQASHLGRTLRSDPKGQKVEISNPGMGIKVQRSCLGDLSPTSRCCSAAWNKLDLAEQPTMRLMVILMMTMMVMMMLMQPKISLMSPNNEGIKPSHAAFSDNRHP